MLIAMALEERGGWLVRTNGGPDARRRVLLLPGLFCTAAFFQDMLDDEQLVAAGIHAIAAEPPGFAGNEPADDFDYSIESYAAIVEQFASDNGIDLIVGHSFSANIAIEIAARGNFNGPLLLLSPSLSREDEEDDLISLYEAGKTPVVGTLVWLGLNPTLKHGMKELLPESRFDELMGEMKRNPHKASKAQLNAFLEHMNKYGSLASRLAESGATAWLGRGDRDPVGVTDEELVTIEASPTVEIKTIPDAAHFSITDAPKHVNKLIIDLLGKVLNQ